MAEMDDLYEDLSDPSNEFNTLDNDLIPDIIEDPEGDITKDFLFGKSLEEQEQEEREEQDKNKTKDTEDTNIDDGDLGKPKEEEIVIKNNDDLVKALLKSKGIEDLDKIKFENDEGEIVEISFDELTSQEKLEILKSSDADINYGLNDVEIDTINYLRQNGATLPEVIEYFKKEAIDDYLAQQNISNVSVEKMSDEELFTLDLKVNFEDLTEDEIQIELENQLNNPELFRKKMANIRGEYLEAEKESLEQQKLTSSNESLKDYENLKDSLINIATTTEDIGGLDLSIDDKNDVLDFILTKDLNGVTDFVKSLENHDQLFKLAWFAKKGDEAFSVIHDYYKKQIDQVRKTSYDKAKKEFEGKNKTSKVTIREKNTDSTTGSYKTMEDLWNT